MREYLWGVGARRLLGLRDRFTRAEVKRDFESNPDSGKVVLDEELKIYATPVAGNRYTVIWQFMGPAQVRVIAVVASQLREEMRAESPDSLMEKFKSVVSRESHGQVSLT